MNKPIFKHVQKGDRPSAKEYNRRGDLLAAIANSLHIQGFFDSTGFHTRRTPAPIAKPTIFAVQNATANKDGIYDCYEQKLLEAEWADTAGDAKFSDKDAVVVEVLNLAEYDPEAFYVAHLTAGDLLAAWKINDDEGNSRWVGTPFRQANADRPRLAFCKDAAGAATAIDCYLDGDGVGTVISVACSIAGGGNLDSAVPRLTDGTPILVTKVGATWWCISIFQASEDCVCTSP